MSRIVRTGSLVLSVTVACVAPSARAEDPATPTYERDIKPILSKRCVVCHNAKKRHDPDISGGLALDTFDGVQAGTVRRKVIVPGRSPESELLRRLVDPDDDRRMPLQDKPLPASQQELIRLWVDAGAPRGVAVATAVGPGRPDAAPRPRRVSRSRSVDVVFSTDVKLPTRTLNAPAGGPLSLAMAIGPLPAVTALAFRGDERLLAVGTYGRVVLWDLRQGHPVGSIPPIPGPVHALVFSRDGRRLAVGGGLPARSGVVQVYSVPDGTKIHEFTGHDDVVFALSLRPDGAQLASGSFDQTVRLWNLGLDRPDGVFRGHSDFVYAVAYTRDGRSLLSASKDRTIKRINVRTLKEERTYSGHDEDVLSVALHPDGARFVSAGDEPQIRWWMLNGDTPSSRRGGHSGPVHQLAFSGDGRRLLSVGGDRSVRLWDGKTGAPIRQLPGPTEWQYAAAISDDGRLAAAGGWDGLVRVWDADTGRLRGTLIQPPVPSTGEGLEPESGRTDWFAVSPSGHVAGSTHLIDLARWRADGVTLTSEVARDAFVRPEVVARAIRGESVPPVSFPSAIRSER